MGRCCDYDTRNMGYLTSFLSISINRKQQETVPTSNLIRVGCLLVYLLFDGLTSIMQGRLFGQAKGREETSSLMSIRPGIIDQMVYHTLLTRKRMFIRGIDMGQLILLHHHASVPIFQPLRPDDIFHQSRSQFANSLTPHLNTFRNDNSRSPRPLPHASNIRRAYRQSHHDSQTICQYCMQRNLVLEHDRHSAFGMGGHWVHGC